MERDFLSLMEQQLFRNNQHRHLVANVGMLSLHKEPLGRFLTVKNTQANKERMPM